jgi:TRAP-type C4-dicarboxylate transport system substrate-binding protein
LFNITLLIQGGKVMKANKKRFISVFLVAFLTVSWMICVDVMARKKPVTLRLVTSVPAGSPPMADMLTNLSNNFNKRTNGEYIIEVYYGGALAKLPEYYDAIMFGTVEMAVAPPGVFANMDPRLGAFETPFLLQTHDAAIDAAQHFLPLYDKVLQEKFNAKGLMLFSDDGFHILSSKPIEKLEDFKGLMVGAVNPTAASLIKDLGGSPVTIMWNQLFESLQKRVIDATTQIYHGMVVTNTADVCKYVTVCYAFMAIQGISINLDVWKKMPPNIQKILQEEADSCASFVYESYKKIKEQDLNSIKKKGVNIYVLPKTERDRWIKATEASREKRLSKLGSYGADVKKIADEANKKHPYTD